MEMERGRCLHARGGMGKLQKVEGEAGGVAWGMRCFASSTFGGKSLALPRGVYILLVCIPTTLACGRGHHLIIFSCRLSIICLSTHSL